MPSASSSSLDGVLSIGGDGRGGGGGPEPDDVPGSFGRSSGGGSSICMCIDPLSSASVGTSPRSMYFCPCKVERMEPISASKSKDLVSKEVALYKTN